MVVVHGGPLGMDWTAANMPAILDVHYPGEVGGDATVAVLFGDVSPSGRATTTWYPLVYQNQRPNNTDMQLAAHNGVPGITYLYYDGPVLWPFGWGLSYTTFTFAWASGAQVERATIDASAFATGAASPPSFSANVTNTGAVTSDVSVLAYYSTGLPGEPLTELFDFQRVAALAPGATATVTFSLPPAIAATVTAEGDAVIVPGLFRIRIGDVRDHSDWSSGGSYVVGEVEIVGQATPHWLFPRELAAGAV